MRTGVYRIVAELQGFTSVNKSGLELQVGQEIVMNLEMSTGRLDQSITVTTEAPLVDVTQSRASGVVDQRQVQELPVNGRSFLDLAMMAPGNRANAITDAPVAGNGNFQINVDGQQVTQGIVGQNFGSPGYSKDAIAEFEYVANRFDATQGRSAGVQVNVITKSGTNTPSGSESGYFRSDRFNAKDFIQQRVLPYSDQQVSTTYGGPIRKDKAHFFLNYEYERRPQTFTYSTPYPFLNLDQSYPQRQNKYGTRVDVQISPHTHFSVRGFKWDYRFFEPRGNNVTTGLHSSQHSNSLFGVLTQVLGNKAVNEFKGGWDGFWFSNDPIVLNGTTGISVLPGFTITPGITLTGLTIGQTGVVPARSFEDNYSIRDDVTYSLEKRGRHTLKVGGEFIRRESISFSCRTCMGVLDVQGSRIPANLEAVFPNPLDATTWNVNLLSSIARSYAIAVGDFRATTPQNVAGAWLQDDWTVTPRLTLNLGLRYDVATNLFGNAMAIPPFLEAGRPNDTNNWAPRVGVAYSLNDKTVLRGGFGKYFGATVSSTSWSTTFFGQTAQIQVLNDGRPDFASNPFNGPVPTYGQALALNQKKTFTAVGLFGLSSPDEEVPYSWQGSVGVQRQLGNTMSMNADYMFTGTRQELYARNINLSYNVATGANYPSTDVAHVPYPAFGPVVEILSGAWSNYNGLSLVFMKRMGQRWQASGNYLLSVAGDGTPPPVTGFAVAPDLGGEYGLSVGDQRHRAVFNGIYQIAYGFQLSGLYFFGSGLRFVNTWGGDLRGTGAAGSARLRPDGAIVARNDFVGAPVHRMDIRIQRRFALGGRAHVDGLLEVFNLINHENYGSYATAQSVANYGQPAANTNVAYTPRAMQLGFRVVF